MGDKDLSMKMYLRDNDRFADVLNGTLFAGEYKVMPESLVDINTELIEQVDDSAVPKYYQRLRDVIKGGVVKSDGEQIYCLFGIENQTSVDYQMPARVMSYDALSYMGQKVTKDEVLRGGKLAPVITLVFNLTNKEWNGPRSIHEMISTSNEEILEYVPNYKINLISPSEMSDEEIDRFKSSIRYVLECSKYQDDKAKLDEITRKNEEYHHLDKETIQVINTHMNMHLKYEEEKGGGYNMCKAIDDMRADSRLEGKIENMYELGCTIEEISELVGESIERVNEVINAYKERNGVSEDKLCERINNMKVIIRKKEKVEFLEKLIQNLYEKGLTIDLISDCLDVSLEKVKEVLGIGMKIN